MKRDCRSGLNTRQKKNICRTHLDFGFQGLILLPRGETDFPVKRIEEPRHRSCRPVDRESGNAARIKEGVDETRTDEIESIRVKGIAFLLSGATQGVRFLFFGKMIVSVDGQPRPGKKDAIWAGPVAIVDKESRIRRKTIYGNKADSIAFVEAAEITKGIRLSASILIKFPML